MDIYLAGQAIYGDDLSFEEIENWYRAEKEAYADLGSKDAENYRYGYHAINQLHGFDHLKGLHFENALGLGAAWGHEFHPIINAIDHLHIIEPSDHMRSDSIGHLKPVYRSPAISGKIDYPDDHFDLIVCFGTLHHIPNVSFVIAELCRVAKPGAYILLREPVISMGNWTQPRSGLTSNERGIPLKIFYEIIKKQGLQVINQSLCFTMTAFFQRSWVKFCKKPIYSFKVYVILDKWLSKLLAWNLQYHALNRLKRIAPQSVFFVLKKC